MSVEDEIRAELARLMERGDQGELDRWLATAAQQYSLDQLSAASGYKPDDILNAMFNASERYGARVNDLRRSTEQTFDPTTTDGEKRAKDIRNGWDLIKDNPVALNKAMWENAISLGDIASATGENLDSLASWLNFTNIAASPSRWQSFEDWDKYNQEQIRRSKNSTTSVGPGPGTNPYRSAAGLPPAPRRSATPVAEGSTLTEEQRLFIEWQAEQINPVTGRPIKETWEKQGIDPYTDPRIAQTAQEQIDRAERREQVYQDAGVLPDEYGIAPWTDPGWRERPPGVSKEAWDQANLNNSDPAARARFQAENNLYGENYESWQLRVLDPEEWARQAAESDRRNGIVAGPSTPNFVVGPTPPGSGGNTGAGGFVTGPGPGGSGPNGSNTNVTSTGAANSQSQQTAVIREAANKAIANYIKNNPSNFIRRRTGKTLLTPTQEAAREKTIAELNTVQESLAVKQASEETPVIVGSSTTFNTTNSQTVVTGTAAALNQGVNYLDDEQLSREEEFRIGTTELPTSTSTTADVRPSSYSIQPRPLLIGNINTTASPVNSSDPLSNAIGTAVLATTVVSALLKTAPSSNVTETTEITLPTPYTTDADATPGWGNTVKVFNPETGTFDLYDNATGEIVKTGLDSESADNLATELNRINVPFTDNNVELAITTGTQLSQAQDNFVTSFDPETGTWGVWNNAEGKFVQTGLTENEANAEVSDIRAELEANTNTPVIVDSEVGITTGNPTDNQFVAAFDPETGTWGVWDNDTGTFSLTGLTQSQANNAATSQQDLDAAIRLQEQEAVVFAASTPVPGQNFDIAFNPGTGNWDVINVDTNEVVESYASQEEALARAEDLAEQALDQGTRPTSSNDTTVDNTAGTPTTSGDRYVAGEAEDGSWTIYDNQTGEVISTGLSEEDAIAGAANLNELDRPTPNTDEDQDAADRAAAEQQAREQAQQQQTLQEQSKLANNGDWRVRLSLAQDAEYLYNDTSGDGILLPLKETGGVIFPYTPQIDTSYRAEYDGVALTHSNYKSYFYKSSFTDSINLTATFTAQDSKEADYLLAVIHFFRSVTKMFYGQDALRGAPPPLVFLTGLGTYQFNNNACLVSNFQYSLPKDVDYIRARSTNINGTDLLTRRVKQSTPSNAVSGAIGRLSNLFSSQGIPKGAEVGGRNLAPTLGLNSPTYVPTKLDMTITLLPVQTRNDVSQTFSLQQYANGTLLRKGFW